jgi:GntR family transcriptional regulator of vanillate catabolism
LSDQEIIPDFQASLRYAQHQHRAIMDAILGREGARAEALTREHARLALTNFNNLKKRGAMSDVIAFGFK